MAENTSLNVPISASSPEPRRWARSNCCKYLETAADCCSAEPSVTGLLRSTSTLTTPITLDTVRLFCLASA
ncbi:hypothetical protein D3C73_1005270 [compost metagenome]